MLGEATALGTKDPQLFSPIVDGFCENPSTSHLLPGQSSI